MKDDEPGDISPNQFSEDFCNQSVARGNCGPSEKAGVDGRGEGVKTPWGMFLPTLRPGRDGGDEAERREGADG